MHTKLPLRVDTNTILICEGHCFCFIVWTTHVWWATRIIRSEAKGALYKCVSIDSSERTFAVQQIVQERGWLGMVMSKPMMLHISIFCVLSFTDSFLSCLCSLLQKMLIIDDVPVPCFFAFCYCHPYIFAFIYELNHIASIMLFWLHGHYEPHTDSKNTNHIHCQLLYTPFWCNHIQTLHSKVWVLIRLLKFVMEKIRCYQGLVVYCEWLNSCLHVYMQLSNMASDHGHKVYTNVPSNIRESGHKLTHFIPLSPLTYLGLSPSLPIFSSEQHHYCVSLAGPCTGGYYLLHIPLLWLSY